jgi:hypothetical protein
LCFGTSRADAPRATRIRPEIRASGGPSGVPEPAGRSVLFSPPAVTPIRATFPVVSTLRRAIAPRAVPSSAPPATPRNSAAGSCSSC